MVTYGLLTKSLDQDTAGTLHACATPTRLLSCGQEHSLKGRTAPTTLVGQPRLLLQPRPHHAFEDVALEDDEDDHHGNDGHGRTGGDQVPLGAYLARKEREPNGPRVHLPALAHDDRPQVGVP